MKWLDESFLKPTKVLALREKLWKMKFSVIIISIIAALSIPVQAMTIRDRTLKLNVNVINPSIIEPMNKASFKARIHSLEIKIVCHTSDKNESKMKDGFENCFKMHQTSLQVDDEKSKSTTTVSTYIQTFTPVLKFSSWTSLKTA